MIIELDLCNAFKQYLINLFEIKLQVTKVHLLQFFLFVFASPQCKCIKIIIGVSWVKLISQGKFKPTTWTMIMLCYLFIFASLQKVCITCLRNRGVQISITIDYKLDFAERASKADSVSSSIKKRFASLYCPNFVAIDLLRFSYHCLNKCYTINIPRIEIHVITLCTKSIIQVNFP